MGLTTIHLFLYNICNINYIIAIVYNYLLYYMITIIILSCTHIKICYGKNTLAIRRPSDTL